MYPNMQPSTDWNEQIASHETERYAANSERFAAIQARKSAKFGTSRAPHRKQLTTVSGMLEVLPDLMEFVRHGFFAKRSAFEVWARLSNGGLDRAADATPISAPPEAQMIKLCS